MDPKKELETLIVSQLNNACKTNLPRLCDFIKSPEGIETAKNMIFTYCTENGVSVQTAMAHIDSEL